MAGETQPKKTEHESDIEWQRLELEKARLKLDTERVALEKAKDRTTKLQIGLPLLVSILALAFTAFNERQRSWLEFNKAASSYNEGRYELFRRRTEHKTDPTEIMSIYAEIFPNDSKSLLAEQKAPAGK
jgi:hypothetical protein